MASGDGWTQMGIALFFVPIAVAVGSIIGGAVAVFVRHPRPRGFRRVLEDMILATMAVGFATGVFAVAGTIAMAVLFEGAVADSGS
jgi:hypothetical protein